MTIYTTDHTLSSEKKDLIDGGADVELQCPEEKALTKGPDEVDLEYCVYNDPVVPIRVQSRPPKRRVGVQICLLLGMLAGLTVSIMASLYLYRTLSILRYRGRCGVGLIDMSRFNGTHEQPVTQGYTSDTPLFEQEVEIDDQVETIHVPEADGFDEAIIKHDFSNNVTAVRSVTDEMCYLIPLLKDLIPSPPELQRVSREFEDDGRFPLVKDHHLSYLVAEDISSLTDELKQLCAGVKTVQATPVEVSTTTTTTAATLAVLSLNSVDPFMIPEMAVPMRLRKNYREFPGGEYMLSYEFWLID